MGLALVPVGVSSLIGTPISGAILGPDYDWWKGVVFSSVSVVISVVKQAERTEWPNLPEDYNAGRGYTHVLNPIA